MSVQPRRTPDTASAAATVRLEGVGFGYAQTHRALRDINLTLAAGSFHFLTGPSGAGVSASDSDSGSGSSRCPKLTASVGVEDWDSSNGSSSVARHVWRHDLQRTVRPLAPIASSGVK